MSNLVTFFEDWDYMQPDCIIAYLAGMTLEVDDDTAEQAVAAEVAELVEDEEDDYDRDDHEAFDVE